ncbi:MAG: SulP family inorganic anion transporter [Deltaproteobacteria bacterium]|nr:SulP family inorganic anion transporter [Deltaproteobacteria bacterium]
MLTRVFPFILWFKDYDFPKFRIDFLAGVTVALVLIPQSMAYAQLAGLPAYYGLYASFLPPMIAALFGSSRQLATGPVAVVSLMTAASLEPLATAGSEAFIAYAVLLALTVGVFQLLLGVFRLGLIVNFLSHPVVNGFTNAAAIIIASSQLSKMFGVYVDKAPHHYETIIRVIQAAVAYTHWPTLIIGVVAILLMYFLKRINPRIPNVLVAVVITTLFSMLIGFEHNERVVISDIQSQSIHETITDFNHAVREIATIGEERSDLIKELDELKTQSGHDSHTPSFDLLDMEYKITVANAKIAAQKRHCHLLRKRLREVLFSTVEKENKHILFYPQDSAHEGVETDGRIWRIKVGNRAIDESNILMIGGGAVVGVVPKGLPSLGMPKINFLLFFQLLPFAVIISLLGFMEAIAIAKAMAAKTGQRLDPNQELIGQGLANIIGALGKSYPVSGSFSRSAVNLQSGAVSGLSSVITSLVVIVALLFLTPLLYHLPQAVLASVIMMAVIGLVNVTGFIHAWRAQWYDGAISIITFIATLALAPHLEKGIYIGVSLSLAVFLYKSMRPTVSSLSKHEDEAHRDIATHDLMGCKYIDLVRFEGPLFFANASFLEDEINNRVLAKKDLKHIIIAANGINDMDASGEESLSLIIENLRSSGLGISFSGINETVMAVLKRTHLFEEIGKENIQPTMEKAILAVHYETHKDGDEEQCPLITTVSNAVKHMSKKGE